MFTTISIDGIKFNSKTESSFYIYLKQQRDKGKIALIIIHPTTVLQDEFYIDSKKHAAIMGPKFKAVVDALDREIAPLEIASWRRPKGGYFVSLDAMPGTAKRTLALCKEAGVTMTGAGATFPYGKDPQDSNIRIAPSLPPVEELEQAIAVLCVCLKIAALEVLGV